MSHQQGYAEVSCCMRRRTEGGHHEGCGRVIATRKAEKILRILESA